MVDQIRHGFLLYLATDLPAKYLKQMVLKRRNAIETFLKTLRTEAEQDEVSIHINLDTTLSMCMVEIDWLE